MSLFSQMYELQIFGRREGKLLDILADILEPLGWKLSNQYRNSVFFKNRDRWSIRVEERLGGKHRYFDIQLYTSSGKEEYKADTLNLSSLKAFLRMFGKNPEKYGKKK